MSCRYVCSSCQKRLLSTWTTNKAPTQIYSRAHSNVSAASKRRRPSNRSKQPTTPWGLDSTLPSESSNGAAVAQAIENLRTAEDDFLDRILQGQSYEYGPYSRPRDSKKPVANSEIPAQGVSHENDLYYSRPHGSTNPDVKRIYQSQKQVYKNDPDAKIIYQLQGRPSKSGLYSRPRGSKPPAARTNYPFRKTYRFEVPHASQTSHKPEFKAPDPVPEEVLCSQSDQEASPAISQSQVSSSCERIPGAFHRSPVMSKQIESTSEDHSDPIARDHSTNSHANDAQVQELPSNSYIAAICDRKHSALQAWSLFQQFPDHPSAPKRVLLKGIEKPLLRTILYFWSSGSLVGSELSPSIAFRELHRQGFRPGSLGWRRLVMRGIRDALLHFGRSRQNFSARLDPKSSCLELINIWNLALDLSKYAGSDPNSKLSNSMAAMGTEMAARRPFADLYKLRFPSELARSVDGSEMFFLASYLILKGRCQRLDTQIDEVRQYQAFIQYANHLLTLSPPVPPELLQDFLLSSNGGFPQNRVKLLCEALKATQRDLKVKQSLSKSSSEVAAVQSGTRMGGEDFKSNLQRAIASSDVMHVDELWTRAEHEISQSQMILPAELYLQFIGAFANLHRPNRAVDVWNAMVRAGYTPKINVWDSMLRGFAAVRSREGVEDIWRLLQQSGLPLDNRIWATRIRALRFSSSRAMSAFEEMMNAWLLEVKKTSGRSIVTAEDLATLGDVNGVPKPTVDVLNAAVLAVAPGFHGSERLGKLFSWAEALGIQPDIYTFNTVIRAAAKQGDNETITNTLNLMHQQGVEVDITTFTMILQSSFRDSSPSERESTEAEEDSTSLVSEKLDISARILDEMSLVGLEANAYTYSIIISNLLKSSVSETAGLQAAKAVIKYMRAKGIPLSSQIYTSLLTAYFERNWTKNVVGTWKEARRDDAAVLDEVFYDRLVEGFAKQDDTKRMRDAMIEAGRTGRVVGWIALTEAIQAFARASDMESVQDIIEQVTKEEQSTDRMRKGKGQHWFWTTVRDMGFPTPAGSLE